MNPTSTPSDEILTRFLRDDCTRHESDTIHAWLAASPDHGRRLERLRRILAAPVDDEWNVDAMWARVRTKTVEATRPAARLSVARRPTFHVGVPVRAWRTPVAAALVLISVGTGIWLDRMPHKPKAVPATPDIVYQTRRGQTATVQLSDGSRVRLAPQSRLTIPGAFGDSLRELTLEGEAEFDVRHDSTRPLRVRTARTVTEDIGTRFGIRAYGDEARVTVAVAEGAVTLSRRDGPVARHTPHPGVLLRAGDLGSLDPSGNVATAHGVAASRALAWTRNELVFAKQPLADVLATLARWYDLDIHVIDPSVAAHPVTAEFSTQSVDEMLQSLAIAVDAVVERDGRHVMLKGRP